MPVFPVLPYGITPYFRAYPGSVTLRVQTYLAVVRDLLDGLHEQGFRRILIVNGHGGNTPAQGFAAEWMADHPGARVKFHNWWNAPQVWAKVQATDANASHASWMENFPWTRLEGVELPDEEKAAHRPEPHAPARSAGSCAAIWGRATSAANSSAPTTTCRPSGTWRWRRPAPCWKAGGPSDGAGAVATRARLGRGGHRRHDRSVSGARRTST